MNTRMGVSASNRRMSSGFTLLEILVASVAFAMIVMVIKITLLESLELRERGQARMDKINIQMRVVEVIENDLQQCLLTETTFAPDFKGDTLNGGVTRTDQLEFYTLSGMTLTNQPWGNLQKVRYYLEQPLNEGRNELSEGLTLYREVTRDLNPTVQDVILPQAIANRINSLAFQYFDGEFWQENWDSTVDDTKLPVAVRVRIEFLHDETQSKTRSNQLKDEALPFIQSTIALMAVPQIEEEETDEELNAGDA
jgi:type II secretion system protein J